MSLDPSEDGRRAGIDAAREWRTPMPSRSFVLRASAAAFGGVLLSGVAGLAVADEYGSDDIDVQVEIAEIDEPGTLALTVASDSVHLQEQGSTATVRQFTGSLPSVTVTDTRDAGDVGTGWYVLGTATAFAGSAGQPAIDAGHLGWTPHLIDGGASGSVAEGEQVDTILDSGPDAVGLVGQELLALLADPSASTVEGQWTANAELFLRTPASVEPGGYASTLTLSLWED
ncbi:hypothetical protein ACGGZK_11335 [Agromyces sp. MMS24-K17]|uniref:hypothetical protein n=1 Tax=Agromyces sp. MMS24-K17 TaxID=3372850 RepID=UPI003754ED3F